MIERMMQRMAMAIRPRAFAGMILAGFAGLAVAIPGVYWAIYFGGGGHGTVSPAYVLFGPVMLAWYQMASVDPPNQTGELWLVGGMLGLYAVYAVALAWGRSRSIGKWIAIAVLVFHYALVAVLTVIEPHMSSFQAFTNLLGSVPFYHSLGLIEYFFLLHIAAAAFAVSSRPVSRKGVERTAMCVALVSLVSLAYVVWAIATSTR
jgi:hypothetical protein